MKRLPESSPARGGDARAGVDTDGVRLRYATTSDGVDIAHVVLGAGPPVLFLFPYHVSNLAVTLLVPPHRRGLAALAQACSVVAIDLRGSGQSTRDCGMLSLEAFTRDLEAVRMARGAASVALCAVGAAALVACAYAARHPSRLSRLAFVQAGHSETNRRLLALRRASASVEARLRAQALAPHHDEGTLAALGAAARTALAPDQLAQWETLLDSTDLLALAGQVHAPALCVHASGDDLVDTQAADTFARALRHGLRWTAPAATGLSVWDDHDTLQAIRQFLAGRTGHTEREPRPSPATGSLSARELSVLYLVAQGRTNREIASALAVSVHTVSFHLRGIFTKTGAANRTEAAATAHRMGLLA